MYTCVECDEVITNPISEQRLALEFKIWLAETDSNLLKQFNEECVYRSEFLSYENVMSECIITHEKMGICPYCTTAQFITWLHRKTILPRALERALDFFLARQDEQNILRSLRCKNERGVKITLDSFLYAGLKEEMLS